MKFLRFLLSLVTFQLSQSVPTTTPLTNLSDGPPPEIHSKQSKNQTDNKSISELVNKQTDVIRKIISAHKTAIETPLLNNKETPTTNEANEENQSIEELKAKCEYYFKFFVAKQQETANEKASYEQHFQNHRPTPFYIENVSTTQKIPTNAPGRYITKNQFWPQFALNYAPQTYTPTVYPQYIPSNFDNQPATENPSIDTNQQLIQSSQQIYSYLPYASEAQNFQQENSNNFHQEKSNNFHPENLQNFHQENLQNFHQELQNFQENSQQITQSYEENKIDVNKMQQQNAYVKLEPVMLQKTLLSDGKTIYYWYKTLPYHVYSDSKNLQTSETTNQEIKTPPTTTESPNFQDGKNLYKSQFKFVIPVAYPNGNNWQFERYYPKKFQPAYMKLPVPYAPTFHMIRTIKLPNDQIKE